MNIVMQFKNITNKQTRNGYLSKQKVLNR